MFKKLLLHLPLVLVLGVTTAAPAVAHVPGEVQLMTAATGPWVEHTIRHGAGTWDRFNQLDTGTGKAPTDLAAAIVSGELNLVYDVEDASIRINRTRLRIRHADGTWSDQPTPFEFNSGVNSVAAVNGELHLVKQVVGRFTSVRHAVRRADGSWTNSNSFVPVQGAPPAAVATNGTLEVLAVNGESVVSTTLRADGTWTPAAPTTSLPAGVSAGRLAVARVGADLHVVARSSAGALLHAIRRPDGTWTGWGDVGRETGVPGQISLPAVTASRNTLHLAVTTDTGGLFHAIRFEDGTWQRFGDVRGEAGGSASTYLAIAGD